MKLNITFSFCQLSRILRKHKSNDQQNTIRENERHNYKSMSPLKKETLLNRKELKYKEMDPRIKQPLFKKLGLKYNEMDPINKQILLDNLHLKYNETIDKKRFFSKNKQ